MFIKMDRMDAERMIENFKRFLSSQSLTLADVDISDTKGFWYVKDGCKGGEQCRHAFRGELGPCDGKGKLIVSYSEHGLRERNGRWIRPYRVWEEMKKKA